MKLLWLYTFDKVKAWTRLPMSLISHNKHKVESNSNSNLTSNKCCYLPHTLWCLNKNMVQNSRTWVSSKMLHALGTLASVDLAPLTELRASLHGILVLFCPLGSCVHGFFGLPLYMVPFYLCELTFPSVDSDFWDVITSLLIPPRP